MMNSKSVIYEVAQGHETGRDREASWGQSPLINCKYNKFKKIFKTYLSFAFFNIFSISFWSQFFSKFLQGCCAIFLQFILFEKLRYVFPNFSKIFAKSLNTSAVSEAISKFTVKYHKIFIQIFQNVCQTFEYYLTILVILLRSFSLIFLKFYEQSTHSIA